ncbi:MAG: tRNA threonylcarbamoyladenosine dehydratase [Clostridia bacterium]|nr:tRNA threonylcarbamoyladenosine dehydratase [Clostridia bacterium]
MDEAFIRTQMLLKEEGIERLKKAVVAVFGIGGVGGYAVEALARAGVGEIHLFDHDTVSVSNRNRQIIATVQSVGRKKVEVMRERVLSINPNARVVARDMFFMPENADEVDFSLFDYVIDAVDTVTAKLTIVSRCKEQGVSVISAMGTGNKLDPTAFEVADISKTSVCPLARVMRRELKARGISSLRVVYSKEIPLSPESAEEDTERRKTPGSVSFVPPVAGLLIASEVIKALAGYGKTT